MDELSQKEQLELATFLDQEENTRVQPQGFFSTYLHRQLQTIFQFREHYSHIL